MATYRINFYCWIIDAEDYAEAEEIVKEKLKNENPDYRIDFKSSR